MDVQQSDDRRGHAYRFSEWEERTIAKALKPEIRRIKREIEKVKNDPENEGQADFLARIRELAGDIRSLEEIIRYMEGR